MSRFLREKLNSFYNVETQDRRVEYDPILKLFSKGAREIKGQIADSLDGSGGGGNRDVIPALLPNNRPETFPGNYPYQRHFVALFHGLGTTVVRVKSLIIDTSLLSGSSHFSGVSAPSRNENNHRIKRVSVKSRVHKKKPPFREVGYTRFKFKNN